MSKQNTTPRKLGRGISSLMNLAPVKVEIPSENIQTNAAPANQGAIASTAAVGGAVIAAPAIPSAAAVHNVPVLDEAGHLLGHMRHIAVIDVVPNQFQPRREFDEASLTELATSIRALGVVQPIVVRQLSASTYTSDSPAGARYELIAGERRWRAAQLVGLETIPAVVRHASDRESASMALAENVQRAELNPIEVGSALARLHSAFNMSQSEIASEVGLERPTVTNLIRLLDLPASIRDLVAAGALSKGHAKVLLAMEAPAAHTAPDQDRRVTLARKAAEQGWSIRKLEDAARLLAAASHAHAAPSIEAKPVTRFEANLADLEKHLGEKLGTRVKIKPQKGEKGRTRGRIIISYYDLDHFAGVMAKITTDHMTGPE